MYASDAEMLKAQVCSDLTMMLIMMQGRYASDAQAQQQQQQQQDETEAEKKVYVAAVRKRLHQDWPYTFFPPELAEFWIEEPGKDGLFKDLLRGVPSAAEVEPAAGFCSGFLAALKPTRSVTRCRNSCV